MGLPYFVPAAQYLKRWDSIEHVALVYEDAWDGYHGPMDLERAKAGLRERHPDWQIWYVPADRGVIWCARPRTYVSADTPGLLEAGILSASQQESQPFDPEGDTPHRA